MRFNKIHLILLLFLLHFLLLPLYATSDFVEGPNAKGGEEELTDKFAGAKKVASVDWKGGRGFGGRRGGGFGGSRGRGRGFGGFGWGGPTIFVFATGHHHHNGSSNTSVDSPCLFLLLFLIMYLFDILRG